MSHGEGHSFAKPGFAVHYSRRGAGSPSPIFASITWGWFANNKLVATGAVYRQDTDLYYLCLGNAITAGMATLYASVGTIDLACFDFRMCNRSRVSA